MSAEQLQVLIYSKLLFITITFPLPSLALADHSTAQGDAEYSRLKVSLLTSQCLVAIVFEQLGINLAQNFAVQLQYHGRYDKRRRKNMMEKLFTLT